MSERDLGAPPPSPEPAMLIEPRDLETAERALSRTDAADVLAQFERDQLARDIAAIESATAALRRAEPALQSWTTPPQMPAAPKSRPLWLLIGLLWLSTAIVTAGAAYAIAVLYG